MSGGATGPGSAGAGPRVLVVSPYYAPAWRGGGPIRTLTAMVAAHGERCRFVVLTSAFDWGESDPMDVPTDRWVDVGAARVRYLPVAGVGSLVSPGSLRAWWRAWREATASPSGPPDITYLTGVFPPVWSILPLVLRRAGLLRTGQVLVAPRGEFGAGAMSLKAGKKRAFLRVAGVLGLFRDVAWHASSPKEASDIRRVIDPLAPNPRIVVRENETELPDRAWRPDAPASPEAAPSEVAPTEAAPGEAMSTRLRLVYVGRLSPKKGIDLLLEALPHVTAPVEVTVAGSAAEPEYLAHLHRLADASPHRVTFAGAVPHEAVLPLLREHDLFVFPTANENFGHAIAEALAVSVPVMVHADATPWPALLGAHADALDLLDSYEPADWARCIDAYAGLTSVERHKARLRAADAYDAWRATRSEESVFDLL